jgi:hypothetical protein
MAGEALAHVQGESPKANAAVLARLSSSPATSALLVAAPAQGELPMEPSSSVQAYSFLADALSKFHTAPEWIQALWLVTVPVTIVGASACLMRAVRDIAAALIRHGGRHGIWQGRPVYALYQAPDGRWMLYAHGTVRELEVGDSVPEEALPSLARRH